MRQVNRSTIPRVKMMNTIKIIHATTNYLDPLVKLFDQYRQFYGQTSNLDQSKSFIKERIENQESVIFFALDNKIMC